jgi:hypothetical protein
LSDDEDDDNDDSDATPTLDNGTPVIISNNVQPDNVGAKGQIDNEPVNVVRAVPPVPRPQETRAERDKRLCRIRC